MTAKWTQRFQEQRKRICDALEPLLQGDAHCSRCEVPWDNETAALCEFCSAVNDMGDKKNGTVLTQIPDWMKVKLEYMFLPNTKNHRKSLSVGYVIQQKVGPTIKMANFYHIAALCNGDIGLLYENPVCFSFADAAKAMSLTVLAQNMIQQWEQLAPVGWSHPGITRDRVFVCTLDPPAVGWRELHLSVFTLNNPRKWYSTMLTYASFLNGFGYNAYTPMVWLLKATEHDESVANSQEWEDVFGTAAALVRSRLRTHRLPHILYHIHLENTFT